MSFCATAMSCKPHNIWPVSGMSLEKSKPASYSIEASSSMEASSTLCHCRVLQTSQHPACIWNELRDSPLAAWRPDPV